MPLRRAMTHLAVTTTSTHLFAQLYTGLKRVATLRVTNRRDMQQWSGPARVGQGGVKWGSPRGGFRATPAPVLGQTPLFGYTPYYSYLTTYMFYYKWFYTAYIYSFF